MPLNQYFYQTLINNEIFLNTPENFNDPFDSNYDYFLQGTIKEWRRFLTHVFPLNIPQTFKPQDITKAKKEYNKRINIILTLLETLAPHNKNKKGKNIYRFDDKSQISHIGKDTYWDLQYFQNILKDNLSYDWELETQKHKTEHKALYFNVAKHIKWFIKNPVAICSFSKTPIETLMWSHYANHHKGVCLGFKCIRKDKKLFLNTKAQNHQFKKIKYPTNNKTQIINFVKDHTSKNRMEKPFTTKTKQWKYEQEYRIIDKLTKEEIEARQTSKFLKFEPDTLHEIIFGLRCSEKEKETAYIFLNNLRQQYPNIKFKQAINKEEIKIKKININTKIHKTISLNDFKIEYYQP